MKRNPSLSDINSLVTLGMVGVLGYLGYKYIWPLLTGLNKSIDTGLDTVTQPLATWYVDLTSGPSAASLVKGSVILPTGEAVSMADIAATGTWSKFTQDDGSPGFSFMWNNQTWAITSGHDANGNYPASLAPFGITTPGW